MKDSNIWNSNLISGMLPKEYLKKLCSLQEPTVCIVYQYLITFMPGGSKKLCMLKQTCSWKLLLKYLLHFTTTRYWLTYIYLPLCGSGWYIAKYDFCIQNIHFLFRKNRKNFEVSVYFICCVVTFFDTFFMQKKMLTKDAHHVFKLYAPPEWYYGYARNTAFTDCLLVLGNCAQDINHLYWAIFTCNKNGKELIERFASLKHHFVNKHTFSQNPYYKKCDHPPLSIEQLQKNQWLEMGSAAHEKLVKITSEKTLVADLEHMTEQLNSTLLEVFHAKKYFISQRVRSSEWKRWWHKILSIVCTGQSSHATKMEEK